MVGTPAVAGPEASRTPFGGLATDACVLARERAVDALGLGEADVGQTPGVMIDIAVLLFQR